MNTGVSSKFGAQSSKRLAVLCAASLLLTGCTGVLDPHIRPSVNDVENFKGRQNTFENLSALEYADLYQDQYLKAVGNNGRFRTYGGLTLIGLGSAAFGLGATGVGGDTTLLTGLAGTALYSGSSYLSGNTRMRSYHMGYNAIACAKEVYAPLNASRRGPQYERFQAAIADNGLPTLIQDAKTELSILGLMISMSKELPDSQQQYLTKFVESGQQKILKAEDILETGVSAYGELHMADDKLKLAVSRINGEVNQGVTEGLPSFEAARSAIASLGEVYSTFSTAAETLRPAAPAPVSDAQTEIALEKKESAISNRDEKILEKLSSVANKLAELDQHASSVDHFIKALRASQPDKVLENCGVDIAAVAKALSLSSSDLVVPEGEVSTRQVIIEGGTKPYRIETVGNIEGVTTHLGYSSIDVVIDESAKPGSHTVTVFDVTGEKSAVFRIVIEAPQIPATGTGGAGKANKSDVTETIDCKDFANLQPLEASKCVLKDLPKSDVAAVQKAICIPEDNLDGIWGPESQAAFEKAVDAGRVTAPEKRISENIVTALKKLTDEEIDKACRDPSK